MKVPPGDGASGGTADPRLKVIRMSSVSRRSKLVIRVTKISLKAPGYGMLCCTVAVRKVGV